MHTVSTAVQKLVIKLREVKARQMISIYLHVEVKINGEWLHYNHPDVLDDYLLFARMANVWIDYEDPDMMTPVEPLVLPRGLPEDMTAMTSFDAHLWDDYHCHSHSYLTGKEVAQLEEWSRQQPRFKPRWSWFENTFGFLFGNSYTGFFDGPSWNYPAGLTDFRFVFWFA